MNTNTLKSLFRLLRSATLVLSCLALSVPAMTTSQDGKIAISYKSFSGMCQGYCSTEFTVDETGFSSAEIGQPAARYPKKVVKGQVSSEDWKTLVGLIDKKTMIALPDTIGCPGCTDGPVRTLEISFADGYTKKVRFEATPESIKSLIVAIDKLRRKSIASAGH